MVRRVSAARIQKNFSYTYEEAAEVVGVTVQTIRTWRRRGLLVLSGKQPHLIVGSQLKSFLEEQRQKRPPMSMGEFNCLRCKCRTPAALGLVTYHPTNSKAGRLEAFCETCEGPCSRIISDA